MATLRSLTAGAFLATALAAAAMAGPPAARPAHPPLPTGKVSKNIVCTTVPEFHCNVYVPRAYKASTPTPILYVFSPGGPAPVEAYAPAADKVGWIICASVESSNGHESDYYEKVYGAMSGEMSGRFNLHPRRTYFCGFSGGSRVSLRLLCDHSNCSAGVIAMGAAQTCRDRQRVMPWAACVGAAGWDDFNFYEMLRQYRAAKSEKWSYLFIDFKGPHQWAPPVQFRQAINWLDEQYFIRGTQLSEAEKASRPGVIERCVRRIVAAGATLPAYMEAEQLRDDLNGDADAEQARKLDDFLQSSRPKLAMELDARDALMNAYAELAGADGTWREAVKLGESANAVAAKYPGTLFGRHAGHVAGSLEKRRELFPPELRKMGEQPRPGPTIRVRPQPGTQPDSTK